MIKYLFLLTFVVSSSLFAATLEVEDYLYEVKPFSRIKPTVMLVDDNGERSDVSHLVSYSSMDARDEGSGSLYIQFPRFPDTFLERTFISVTVRYENIQKDMRISVNLRPMFMRISGRSTLYSMDSGFYRVSAQYAGGSVSLRNMGRWSSSFGYMGNDGYFRAPRLRNGESSRYGRISFRFAGMSETKSITVYSRN